MEQTIGKRIMENRKRLGLTQDALAERLGVTAQAVSKWENDQSCPDITMLPKLAEIFACSTDELLGREPQPIHQAEVVDEEENDTDGIHIQKGNWEFHMDSPRHSALLFAILVLLVGGLCLANVLLKWEVGFWSILWPSALLVFGLDALIRKFSFFGLGCALFGGYFLVDNLGIWHLDIGSELVFPIIIVLFGISLLVDALRKPKKRRFRIVNKGNGHEIPEGTPTNNCETGEDSFDCSLAFGEGSHLITLPVLRSGDISCSFGNLTVDLTGCEAVSKNCALDASCSFGELILLVPSRFRVDADSATAFGNIELSGHCDSTPDGVIRLDASANFGNIEIRYI